MSYQKPFWLKGETEPKVYNADEEDAIMRRAARQVFLPQRVRTLEEKLAKTDTEKNHPKSFDGLKQKKQNVDLDRYNLTERQYEVMSLRLEYGLPKIEIAKRLRIHRTTVDEHLKAADRRMNAEFSSRRSKQKSPIDGFAGDGENET